MESHDIKNILEERRIEVSEHSWEKLAGQLDANDRKERKKKFYIPYAACLALLVGWIIFMIAKSETEVGDDMMVNQENTSKTIIKKENSQKNIVPQKEIEETKEAIQETQIAVQEPTVQDKKEEVKAPQIVPKATEKLAVELPKEINTAVVVQEKETPLKIETTITQKEAIVDPDADLKASIKAFLKDEKVKVTNAEIDQLLKEAQESIKEFDVKETINYTNFATADELLNEVEYELDRSFKQRVFEMVKRNIQKTRTADIDR